MQTPEELENYLRVYNIKIRHFQRFYKTIDDIDEEEF